MTGTLLFITVLLAFWASFGVSILNGMLQSNSNFVRLVCVAISLPTAILGAFQIFGFIVLAACLAAPFIVHIG